MLYSSTMKPRSLLAGSVIATIPALIAIGLIYALRIDPYIALLLCIAALATAARYAGRRFCLVALLLCVLFAAYYLPPTDSLQIDSAYRAAFALFTSISLFVCVDGKHLKQTLAFFRHGAIHAESLYQPAAMATVGVSDQPRNEERGTCLPTLKRILYVDHTALLSGGELALLNLIVSLDRKRYVPLVVLFADGPLAIRLAEADIETHILPLAPSVLQTRKDSLTGASILRLKDIARILMHIGRLARFIPEHRIDIVHTNSLKADVIGGFAARLACVPVIWHVRDRIETDYLPQLAVSVFRWLCRYVPDYVVTNSRATLETLKLKPSAPSVSIPSGARYDQLRQRVHNGMQHTREALADQPATERAARIGLIGRIAPWKGQHIFLRAAALVRERFPQTHFQIIGASLFDEQEYEAELRALASTLGLNAHVEFTGFRSDIPRVIADLDMLVHASTVAEPFGQVIIEGMAAGKPVVATNGGGIPEIVVDGVTGLLVPMGDACAMADAICRLLADPTAAHEMGERGFQRVGEHFTIEQTARSVEHVYTQVLQRRSAR